MLAAQTAHWALCIGALDKLDKELGHNRKAGETLKELKGALTKINPDLNFYRDENKTSVVHAKSTKKRMIR